MQTEVHTVRQLFKFQDVCVVWRHLTVRQHAILHTEWLITLIDEELTKAARLALVEEASKASEVKAAVPALVEEASGASEVKAAGPALVEEASRASEVKDDLTVDPDPSIRRGTKKRLRLMRVDEI